MAFSVFSSFIIIIIKIGNAKKFTDILSKRLGSLQSLIDFKRFNKRSSPVRY